MNRLPEQDGIDVLGRPESRNRADGVYEEFPLFLWPGIAVISRTSQSLRTRSKDCALCPARHSGSYRASFWVSGIQDLVRALVLSVRTATSR
jgi:hypothetical protein